MINAFTFSQKADGLVVGSRLATVALVAIGAFSADLIGIIQFPWAIWGVSGFYIGAAFVTIAAVMFGRSALVGIYLGMFGAAVVSGRLNALTPLLNFCNVIGVLAPYLYFRFVRKDWKLSNFTDASAFILFGGLVQSILSALWFFGVLWLFGMVTVETIKIAAIGWIAGGVAVQTIVGLPVLVGLSFIFKNKKLEN